MFENILGTGSLPPEIYGQSKPSNQHSAIRGAGDIDLLVPSQDDELHFYTKNHEVRLKPLCDADGLDFHSLHSYLWL